MARDWKPRQPPAKTSLTEIARRYHAAAVALARTLGLSVQETLAAHRESVTAIFIESGRCDLRLPAGVTLPRLAADAPVAQGNGHHPLADQSITSPSNTLVPSDPAPQADHRRDGTGRLPPEARLTPDQARELKRLAQHAFGGYQAGEAQLRHDLGFEPDEKLTLRHIAAHVPVERYEQLRATYEARLQAAVEADVP
jgi:hypothetical protein